MERYDLGGEFLEESLEVEGLAVGAIMHLLQQPEHELVFLVEAEGAGSEEEFPDIGSPLPGVGVEREESVELSDSVGGEYCVFAANVLGEHCLQLLCLDFPL